MSQIKPEDIVSVDEAGCNTNMAREYGKSPIGKRAPGERPVKREHLTMIGALTLEGLEEGFIFEGCVGSDKFLFWVEEYLVPILRKGQVVLLDNNRFHFADGVEEAICAVGARVLYLPPYSPEFNPIEECWSKVKNHLRKAAAWGKEKLYQAISEAFGTITAKNARGWFKHSGYCHDSK